MNKNKKLILTVLSLMLVVAVLSIGCAPQQRPIPERYGTRYYYDNRYDTRLGDRGNPDYFDNNRMYGYMYKDLTREDLTYDNIPNRFGMANERALEDKIEASVERLTQIRDCTVIKSGDTCYVGVDSNQNIENVAALRTEIANKCRAVDPSIRRVYVTLDKDRVTRLRNYARDIDLGQPVRNFLNNIEDLFE